MNFPMRHILMRISLLALALLASSAHAQITAVVTNPFDFGPGTLRQAIIDVNKNNGGTINFNIDPKLFGPGPWTVTPILHLPVIQYRTIINGYSQPGSAIGGPILIEINGLHLLHALVLYFGADNSRISGLSLFGGEKSQILALANQVSINANYIGIRADGETAVAMDTGIVLAMSTGSAIRNNLIGPASSFGMMIGGKQHKIDSNWFGLSQFAAPIKDKSGTAICAGCEVEFLTLIGDITPLLEPALASHLQLMQRGIRDSMITNNVIVNTSAEAIRLTGLPDVSIAVPVPITLVSASFGNTFSKNIVGQDIWGLAEKDNIHTAMTIESHARNNRVVDNTFANSQFGIFLGSAHGNSLGHSPAGVANTIRSNIIRVAKIPIGMNSVSFPVAQDALDIDTGANNLQNRPSLNFAGSNGRVRGEFNGTANQKFIIDFYTSRACTPSGFGSGRF